MNTNRLALTADDLAAAAAALAIQAKAIRRQAEYSTNYGERDTLTKQARTIDHHASKFRSAARRSARNA